MFIAEEDDAILTLTDALFNLNGIPFLKRSDLRESGRRHDLVNHYFNDGIQGMQARLMLQNLDNIELAAESSC